MTTQKIILKALRKGLENQAPSDGECLYASKTTADALYVEGYLDLSALAEAVERALFGKRGNLRFIIVEGLEQASKRLVIEEEEHEYPFTVVDMEPGRHVLNTRRRRADAERDLRSHTARLVVHTILRSLKEDLCDPAGSEAGDIAREK